MLVVGSHNLTRNAIYHQWNDAYFMSGNKDLFDQFTATLETRETQLGDIMTTFSQATQVLADERQALEVLADAGLAPRLRLVPIHRRRADGVA